MNYRKQWEEEKPKCSKCDGDPYIKCPRKNKCDGITADELCKPCEHFCNNCNGSGIEPYNSFLETALTKAIEALEKGKEYCEDFDPHYEYNELWSILANAVYELKGDSQETPVK